MTVSAQGPFLLPALTRIRLYDGRCRVNVNIVNIIDYVRHVGDLLTFFSRFLLIIAINFKVYRLLYLTLGKKIRLSAISCCPDRADWASMRIIIMNMMIFVSIFRLLLIIAPRSKKLQNIFVSPFFYLKIKKKNYQRCHVN